MIQIIVLGCGQSLPPLSATSASASATSASATSASTSATPTASAYNSYEFSEQIHFFNKSQGSARSSRGAPASATGSFLVLKEHFALRRVVLRKCSKEGVC